MQNIRNFAIIAHVDHGKSTLSDRILEHCSAVEKRKMREQVLDSMDLERERGITIKSQSVRLTYQAKNQETYILNLIDTPGHVDFSYEVSRSLSACEGCVLLIDATQGIEAQTLANLYNALGNNLFILPAINKIDLPTADVESVKQQIETIIGLSSSDAALLSAKTGVGVTDLLEAIVQKIPPPPPLSREAPLRCLLVDSWYDAYLGVVILVRVMDGVLRKEQKIKMIATKGLYKIERLGVFTPEKVSVSELVSGEIGFITAAIKQVSDCHVGDTITSVDATVEPLPGFKPSTPVIFCSLFTYDADQFAYFKDCVAKLHLNDASFTYETTQSPALGHGVRCGFLGLLHLEIVKERLEREFDLDLIVTLPNVMHRVSLHKEKIVEVTNPSEMPDQTSILLIEEPWTIVTIIAPTDYVGTLIALCIDKRGTQKDLSVQDQRAIIVFEIPLAEIMFDFYDRMKSLSRGYASMDWEITDYRRADIVKLDFLINGEPVTALSCIVHTSRAESRGREVCLRLKELIPRQQYSVALQAAIGGKIVARETIKQYRKDVALKTLHSKDPSRRKKLLEKQRKGKQRMRSVGRVDIPKNTFIDVLKHQK